MLYNKIKKYLADNSIEIDSVSSYFFLRNDGSGDFIESWDNSSIGVSQPTESQLNSINDTDAIKQSIIPAIKAEAGKRIVSAYPEWKQRNHMAAVMDIQNKELVALKAGNTYALSSDEIATITVAQTAKDSVFTIRAKSDQLEDSLNSMTLAQLEAFDPTDDSNWN